LKLHFHQHHFFLESTTKAVPVAAAQGTVQHVVSMLLC
jgi:hypothetical protein